MGLSPMARLCYRGLEKPNARFVVGRLLILAHFDSSRQGVCLNATRKIFRATTPQSEIYAAFNECQQLRMGKSVCWVEKYYEPRVELIRFRGYPARVSISKSDREIKARTLCALWSRPSA